MEINRYSQITPSRFNPLSFQEIIATPAMQRKRHDDLIAQQEILKTGINKVDPLQVHFNEALSLKSDINNQIQSQAEQLAREGVNPNSQSQILALNRKYNDLISPTGKLGQINAAKQVYNENMKNFIDDAVKKGFSREDAIYNWQNNARKYTGYNSTGNIINIDPLGAPNYVDLQEDLKTVNSMLGKEDIIAMRNSGISFRERSDGSLIMVDKSGRQIQTSNIKAIDNAVKYLNNRWFNPSGEGFQSASFQRMDPRYLYNQITTGTDLMKEASINDNIRNNASLHGFNNKRSSDETLEPININAVNISSNSDLLSRLRGNSSNTSNFMAAGANFGVSGSGGSFPYSGMGINSTGNNSNLLAGSLPREQVVNETLESQEYKKLARALADTDSTLRGLEYKDPKLIQAVENYLTNNPSAVVQNRIVDPFSDPTGKLFASKDIPKDRNAASNLLLERTILGAYEMRDENGEKIKDLSTSKYKLSYQGDATPLSVIGQVDNKGKVKNIFPRHDQNIGARVALLTPTDPDSKEEPRKVYISRSSDDFKTPQFKAMKTISELGNIAHPQPAIYHRIQSDMFDAVGWKNTQIKYNRGKDTYNLKFKDGENSFKHLEFDRENFQKYILSLSEEINGSN